MSHSILWSFKLPMENTLITKLGLTQLLFNEVKVNLNKNHKWMKAYNFLYDSTNDMISYIFGVKFHSKIERISKSFKTPIVMDNSFEIWPCLTCFMNPMFWPFGILYPTQFLVYKISCINKSHVQFDWYIVNQINVGSFHQSLGRIHMSWVLHKK